MQTGESAGACANITPGAMSATTTAAKRALIVIVIYFPGELDAPMLLAKVDKSNPSPTRVGFQSIIQ